MEIKLVTGSFEQREALDLITRLIDVKIRFHEERIRKSDQEEDIKQRESKIIRLQQDLYTIRQELGRSDKLVSIDAELHVRFD
jgi:hypothetical protein